MLIQEELKNSIEYITNCKAYPNDIPSNAELPAVLYKSNGRSRNSNSQLSKTDILDRDFQLIVVSKTASETYTIAEKLAEALEGYSGDLIESKILMIRVTNMTDLYNYTQNTNETTINIQLMIRK